MATDVLLDYEGDPSALDRTLMALPGVPCALVQGSAAPGYLRHDGHYVARVFGAVHLFRLMVEGQGYCKVNRVLDRTL